MSIKPFALAALVLLAGLAPMAAAGGATPTQESTNSNADVYSGTHVSFATDANAVVGYAVDGETVLSSVEVQSESRVESNLGIGVGGDLGAVTDFAGAGLSMDASAQASARVQAESGATITANDHSHGTLLVEADEDQYVALGLNASSEAETTSDGRVLVTTDDGTTAAVMVVGEGDVTVNDDGNVTANVKSNARLVVRSYSNERTEDDERTERLIANGTAAAEIYVDQQDGERVNGTIVYDSDTEITVEQHAENTVNMTVDRAEQQGKVVIASASNLAAETADDVTVRVDGEVAAEASSYSELRAAADDGATSKYILKQRTSAQADAEVLVAVNHFSTRTVSMTSAESDGESNGDASADGDAYAGSHVDFRTNGSAIVGYAVGGDTVASSVEVQSASQVESNLGIGVGGDLGAVTDFVGASLSMDASAETSARIQANSGATLTAHDHSHGTLLVEADEEQYVALGLNASSEAETTSEGRVLVTTDDGTTAAVMVVGEGNATVNDDGNVTANVEADSRLVVRSYSDERSEEDERTEQFIANGTAAAEIYVDQQNDERVNGTITYDSDTEVTVDAESENAVNVTIDRAESQGKVVIASTSQFEAESNDDLTVRVDGEAAAQASSYSELRAAADDGDTSRYMVRSSGSAEADAEVLVAVNHFSERSVSITDADRSTDGSDETTDSDDSETTTEDSDTSDDSETTGDGASSDGTADGSTGSGDGPGFGIVAALLSMVGLGTLLTRR